MSLDIYLYGSANDEWLNTMDEIPNKKARYLNSEYYSPSLVGVITSTFIVKILSYGGDTKMMIYSEFTALLQ